MSTDVSTPEQPLEKRTWHYLQQPRNYEISPCSCGNHDTQWSEYQKHLWCATCEKDFIPEHNGIFAGPIPVKVAAMLGLRFDRFNMETGLVELFDLEKSEFADGVTPESLMAKPQPQPA